MAQLAPARGSDSGCRTTAPPRPAAETSQDCLVARQEQLRGWAHLELTRARMAFCGVQTIAASIDHVISNMSKTLICYCGSAIRTACLLHSSQLLRPRARPAQPLATPCCMLAWAMRVLWVERCPGVPTECDAPTVRLRPGFPVAVAVASIACAHSRYSSDGGCNNAPPGREGLGCSRRQLDQCTAAAPRVALADSGHADWH